MNYFKLTILGASKGGKLSNSFTSLPGQGWTGASVKKKSGGLF